MNEQRTNTDDFGFGPHAEPQRTHWSQSLWSPSEEEENSKRIVVVVTSYRKHLLDEDNLCAKFHIDGLRYAGILPDDCPSQVHIKIRQEKVAKGENEKVLIQIYATEDQLFQKKLQPFSLTR